MQHILGQGISLCVTGREGVNISINGKTCNVAMAISKEKRGEDIVHVLFSLPRSCSIVAHCLQERNSAAPMIFECHGVVSSANPELGVQN